MKDSGASAKPHASSPALPIEESSHPDTKTRILDAAENLFGINGFQATSLRDITSAAEVNLAAVNYHFQTKDALIDAVIARRMEPISRQRLELLAAAGSDPSLEQILTAFLKPIYDIKLECLVPLMGRVMANPDVFIDRVFNKHLQPLSLRFRDALIQALPDLPQVEVLWRFHFTVGVMTHTLLWGNVFPRVTGGLCSIEDREALLQRTVAFLASGFRGPSPALPVEVLPDVSKKDPAAQHNFSDQVDETL